MHACTNNPPGSTHRSHCHWRNQCSHSQSDEHSLVGWLSCHAARLPGPAHAWLSAVLRRADFSHVSPQLLAVCLMSVSLPLKATCDPRRPQLLCLCRLAGTFTFAVVLAVVTEDVVAKVLVSLQHSQMC